MSRFYEALKQASQGTGQLPSELAAPEVSAPSEPSEPPQSLSVADVAAAAGLSAETVVPSPAASLNGSIGIETDLAVDRKVRAIPNAADPMLVEEYRQLRTRIMYQHEKKPFRSLLVTSADPKEGKSLTALNMAWAFSMLPSFKVLVVDGDLRRGHLSHWLRIESRPGLANLLEGTATLNDVVLKSGDIPFQVISLGHSKLSPPELVHSSRWPSKSREICGHFDLVIVDSPPVNLVADAQLLAEGCEAILLVARAFQTSRSTFEKLCRDFQRFRVIGMVLNGCENGSSRHYKHYYSTKS